MNEDEQLALAISLSLGDEPTPGAHQLPPLQSGAIGSMAPSPTQLAPAQSRDGRHRGRQTSRRR